MPCSFKVSLCGLPIMAFAFPIPSKSGCDYTCRFMFDSCLQRSARLFCSFLWCLPTVYFSSNLSTAWEISTLVFGKKYPAIITPAPIAPTKSPIASKNRPITMFPRRYIPMPITRVMTPPRRYSPALFFVPRTCRAALPFLMGHQRVSRFPPRPIFCPCRRNTAKRRPTQE